MLQYVNGFACSVNAESKDLVIEFVQIAPSFNSDNNEPIQEKVVSVVMPEVVAGNLLDALLEVLDKDTFFTEEEMEEEE